MPVEMIGWIAPRVSSEVMASQAALAVERITLGQEITRRNSEEYFRTLVHNTADVILIRLAEAGDRPPSTPLQPCSREDLVDVAAAERH